MPKPFVPLTLEQFADALRDFRFTRAVTAVHMHHTWRPRQGEYAGVRTIDSMWRHHTQANGWNDIAQHLSIAPDGTIWTGRDWNRTPASASGHSAGAFMFETVGNFDVGQERLTGAQREAVIGVIALVQLRCGLPAESLRFHRDFTNAKSCPGSGIVYAEVLAEVRAARARLSQELLVVAGRDAFGEEAAVGSRATSVYGVGGSGRGPFAASEVEDSEAARAAAGPDEGEPECDDNGLAAAGAPDGALDAARGGLRPDEIAMLRRHVINLRQGRFSSGGAMRTRSGDVDAIFREQLPRALDEARKRGAPLRVLFYAHGGLVAEEAGLAMARDLTPWWLAHGVYPIYFVWETGLGETITQLLRGRRELAPTRGISDVSDRAIEEVARGLGGGKVWDGMKHSARESVAPDGGARYAAERLAEFCRRHPGEIELHAAGHSAGSIFHSYFVPTALDLGVPAFATLSLLAPAVRVDTFLQRLAPRLESGRGVRSAAVYTMSKAFELADNCGRAYRKSLLYLVRHAFEAERGADILGLEESLRANPALVRLFGIGGDRATPHEVVWSKSEAAGGRRASAATTHGGFDNDRLTMEGVLRRVLGADDGDAIQPFPAQSSRATTFDLAGGSGAELEAEEPATAEPAAAVPPRTPAAPAKAAGAAATGARRPRLRRALCVGINAYKGDARLNGCVADARLWAKHFDALGFEHVDLILDDQATEAELRRALTELVASGGPGDALVFQYAGHGAFFRDRDGDDEDGQDEALVPVDFDRGGILLDDEQFRIYDQLAEGASLTCFYDCCHSGSMARFAIQSMLQEARTGAAVEEVRPRFIDPTPEMWAEYQRRRDDRRTRGAPKRGVRNRDALKAVVFSACRDDEVALERGGQGVFTGAVAKLLGDAVREGTTNAEFMRRITRAFGAAPSQHPGLDCAPHAEARPLLHPAASGGKPAKPAKSAAKPGAKANGGNGGNGGSAPHDSRETLPEALHETLHHLPRAGLLALIQEASTLLTHSES
jgi:hypothetical protein